MKVFISVLSYLLILLQLFSCASSRYIISPAGDHLRIKAKLLCTEEIDRIEHEQQKRNMYSPFEEYVDKKNEGWELDDSLLYTYYIYANKKSFKDKAVYVQLKRILKKYPPGRMAYILQQHFFFSELRDEAIRLSLDLEDTKILEIIKKELQFYINEDIAISLEKSSYEGYRKIGQHFLKKGHYPVINTKERIFVKVWGQEELYQNALNILNNDLNPNQITVMDQDNLNSLIYGTAICTESNNCWRIIPEGKTNSIGGICYAALKKLSPQMVVDGILRQIYFYKNRSALLVLAIKLGIPNCEYRLNETLLAKGDKYMAQHFLNSGSDRLYQGGKKWAQDNNCYIRIGR